MIKFAASVLVTAAALAACASSGAAHHISAASVKKPVDGYTLHLNYGITSMSTQAFSMSGKSCAGENDDADLVAGAPVVVTNVMGKTLASSQLLGGLVTSSGGVNNCAFTAVVTGIPKGQAFYRVKVGKRAPEQLAATKLTKAVDLTLLS